MKESGPKGAQMMIILVRWLVADESVVAFPLVVKTHPCLTTMSGRKWRRGWQSSEHRGFSPIESL